MNLDRWRDLVSNVQDTFEVEEKGEYFEEEQGGREVEFIDFVSPLGLVRLEFSRRPRVIDKKTVYSNRIGSDVAMEYTYDMENKIEEFAAYKWDDNLEEWLSLENPNLFA
ncbi:MAG: hypothetical protein WCO55_04965 [Candidatus Falkowbacteria bacterium]